MTPTVEFGGIQVDGIAISEVCHRYAVKELCLFGSSARNEMGPDSDIDLIVEFEQGARVGLIKFEQLAEELAALIGRKVDLVTRRGLKPWIRPAALKDARIIYSA